MEAHTSKKRLRPKIAVIIIMFIAGVSAVAYGLRLSDIQFRPRQRFITTAIRSGESESIVLASDVIVSRTDMIFTLHSNKDDYCNYGAYWELARRRFGRWRPVSQLRGGRAVPDIAYIFPPGETKQYHIGWRWLFGELSNGTYMFIRRHCDVYVLIEFTVDSSTIQRLPEEIIIETPPPGTPAPVPGSPAPMVHIDGRIYNRCQIHGRAPVRLDDSFVFIGEVISYSWLFLDVTENLQSNSSHLLGARLYQSGEDLVVVLNNYHMLYRFADLYVAGWPSSKPIINGGIFSNGYYQSYAEVPQVTYCQDDDDDVTLDEIYMEYADLMLQQQNARFYFHIHPTGFNPMQACQLPPEGLRAMYSELNQQFEYIVIRFNALVYTGYYANDIRFVDTPPFVIDGLEDTDFVNQQVIDLYGNSFLATPLRGVQMGRMLISEFDDSILIGRNFVEEDFYMNSYNDVVSIILGYEYIGIYDIGDIIELQLHASKVIESHVIGFFEEGMNFPDMMRNHFYPHYFDRSIVMPFFEINYEPVSDVNSLFQIRHYLMKTSGFIRIQECTYLLTESADTLLDIHERYLLAVNEVADRHGLSYDIPLLPIPR